MFSADQPFPWSKSCGPAFFEVFAVVAMAALWIGVTAGAAEAQQGRMRGAVRDTSGESVSSALVKAEHPENHALDHNDDRR